MKTAIRLEFGRTDSRFIINDNLGMLHEATLVYVIDNLDIFAKGGGRIRGKKENYVKENGYEPE